ncbi:MAG: tyrosine--tRNA ligase [Acholeplasmataceae bacterium]|nr:tyrosine--tRNA ligase [Acholeplasmataceae bacterium]
MDLYEQLQWRGLIKDVSNETKAKELINQEKVKFYCGFDPTGESLTVGHLVQIVRMMFLEKHGHVPVVLIGGATGLIGDPRQTGERKLLELQTSLDNAKKIKEQIKRFLPNAIYVNNYDWISQIDMITFLRDYGKHFNINYMLAKENVQARLETGISYTEFSYMLLQAIDWLHMYQNIDVKIQFGGSDQWGNITSGLELIRKVTDANHQAVGLASPLLLKSDGSKFGKSETDAIWLDESLTTPYQLYQYFLNTTDEDVETFLKMLTLLEKSEIETLISTSKSQPEQRIAQKKLAKEITKLVHGKQALEAAINVTESLFSGSFKNLTENEFLMASKSLETLEVESEIGLLNALSQTKLAQSNREARTFVASGAIMINEQRVVDPTYVLTKNDTYYKMYVVLKRGKKRYSLIKFK